METYKFIRHLKRIANYGPNKGDEMDHKILDVLLFYYDFYAKGLINRRPYHCFYCKRFFPSKGSLKMHQKGKKCKENRKRVTGR